MAQKSTNCILGIPDCDSVSDINNSGTEFTVTLDPGHIQAVCPLCEGHSLTSKGCSREQVIYHTPRGRTATLIHISFPRFYCKDCGVSFTYRPDWIHPWLPITKVLFHSILSDFSSTKSMREIASDNCVSERIVCSVFDAVSIHPDHTLATTICIDEFKGDSGTFDEESRRWHRRRFQCNVVNGDNHSVIDILPSRDYQSLKAYFMDYPAHERKNIQYLCCDMHSGFAKLRHRVFPNAILCIDRFHVVQRLNNAVDYVRIRYQKELKARLDINENDEEAEALYKLLKDSAHLLTTKESNYTVYWESDILAKKQLKLAGIFSLFPDLQVVNDYLQEFHVLTAQKDDALRSLALSAWIQRAKSSEVPELRDAASTIETWKEYILNGLRGGRNNSTCEGLNRKIKDIKRNASGFKNFDNFRKRILLACGSPLLKKEYSYSRKNSGKAASPARKEGDCSEA
ncbi:MAG: ISL3 family transposase [Clostridiales bacterium]|nr:ISL3 family transposase [Clostridiales bacterium]